jgi:hypothetical protein
MHVYINMVFLGSLEGSNTVTVNTLTTTGLVTTPELRIGPGTTVNELVNRVYYGLVTGLSVSDTGTTLTTVTVSGIPSTVNVFVTPRYTGTATPLPSIYARLYDQVAGSFRIAMKVDDETPGTFASSFYWVALE